MRERLSFVKKQLPVVSVLLVVLVVFAQLRTRDVQFPALPEAPKVRDTTRPSDDPPPPPPPQPTWEEFAAKVNTFGKSTQ
jgi:hypothetical protein